MTDAGTPPTPQSETPRSVPVRADPGRLVRASATVAVGTALSRVTGFARVAAIAYALGVSTLAGTYAYANETPNIVYELLLGGILTATLVPLFVQQFERHNEAATSAMVTVSVVALVVITALGVLLAPWIVDLYTIRVHGPTRAEQQELATTLLRCFMPQMLFYGLTALATALLNARRRFAAAAFAPVLNNLVVIAIFIALPRLASGPLTFDRVRKDAGLVLLLGLGTTAGIAAMALALWPALRRAGIRLRFRFSPRDAAECDDSAGCGGRGRIEGVLRLQRLASAGGPGAELPSAANRPRRRQSLYFQ